jgi:hypothetical protein
MQATLGPGGEIIIAARELSIGGTDAAGAHLVRVSRDGVVESAVAFDVGDVIPVGVKVDDANRPVVALYAYSGYQLAAFDATDMLRWSQSVISPTQSSSTCCSLAQGVFDVGRDGSVGVAELSQNGESSARLLNADGSDRWTVTSQPGRWIEFVAVLDSGNVLTTVGTSSELDASDGHVVASSPVLGTVVRCRTLAQPQHSFRPLSEQRVLPRTARVAEPVRPARA